MFLSKTIHGWVNKMVVARTAQQFSPQNQSLPGLEHSKTAGTTSKLQSDESQSNYSSAHNPNMNVHSSAEHSSAEQRSK
jgi:hypothetical protein